MSDPAPSFSVFRPETDAAVRLFCFPHAGGGAAAYRQWARAMGRDVEIWAVSPPGRGGRFQEPPCACMETVVRELAAAIRPHLDVPFAFFGHSGGALVAFELACLLRRNEGVEPRYLFASACAAPHVRSRNAFASLSDAGLVALMEELGTIPSPLARDRGLMELFIPALRADLRLIEAYAYRAEDPLQCAITAFRGTRDPVVGNAEVAAWEEHTRGAFRLVEMNGDHFFIGAERDAVIRIVRDALLSDYASVLA